MNNRKSNVTPDMSPSTSNQQPNKTQVFILRPEILKKLGITAQIPNLQSLAPSASSEKSTTSVKKGTTTRANTSNKQNEISKTSETKTAEETVPSSRRKVIPVTKIADRSVKTKQIRLENLKDLNRKLDGNSTGINVEKQQNKIENNSLETLPKKCTLTSTNKSVEKISNIEKDTSQIKMENVSVRKRFAPKASEKQIKEDSSTTLATATESSKQSSTSILAATEQITEDTTPTPNTKLDASESVKKGQILGSRKRSTRNSVAEENSPVRKSGRKRKLSKLHDDFVTQLNRKKIAKPRKFMDSTMTNLQAKELDEHFTQDNIVESKPVVIKTYSRIKKIPEDKNKSNLQMAEKSQTNINIPSDDTFSESRNYEITASERITELDTRCENEDTVSKESTDHSKEMESAKKNKIKILEIKTIEKTDRINTELLIKSDSDSSMDVTICRENSDITSEVCTEDDIQEILYNQSESLTDESVNLKKLSENTISNSERILSISESSQNELNNEKIFKNEPKDTSVIEEVSSTASNEISVLTNPGKQNEITKDLEIFNMIETTGKATNSTNSTTDNTAKNNKVKEKSKSLSDNLKPKQNILKETTEVLGMHDSAVSTKKNIVKTVDKCQKIKSVLETTENDNQILNTKEVKSLETSNVQDKMLPAIIKVEKSPIVELEVVQKSFSTESSIVMSTPIFKKRLGRSRKSNWKLETSNIENINSKSLVSDAENTNIDSTLENSILSESGIQSGKPMKKRPSRLRKNLLVRDEIKAENSISIQEEITETSSMQNAVEDSEDEDVFPTRRKRGRPKKILEIVSDNDDDEEQGKVNSENDESVSENKLVAKRGRKRNVDVAEEEVNVNKPIISADGLVQCAVCKAETKNSGWANHCAKHNFLTWRVGEQEINVQDRGVVSSVLYKATKGRKHVFTCETCGDKKKSVVGYLSHLDQCQKTKEEIANMRVACTICGRLMQPASLKVHMAVHNDKAKVEIKSEELTVDTKKKRQAAKKAVGLIQEVSQEENARPLKKPLYRKGYKKVADTRKLPFYGGLNQSLRLKLEKTGTVGCQIKTCTYTTQNIDELKEHFNSCAELKTNDIVCCYCLHITEDEAEMIRHVRKNHVKSKGEDPEHENEEDANEEEYDEDEFEPDEDEVEEKRVRTVLTVTQRKYTYKIDFLAREKRMLPSLVCTYPATFNWTMDFVRENYANKQLFLNYKSPELDWTLLTEEKYRDYLPELKKSMCVEQVVIKRSIPCLQGKEYSWREYDLFESDISADTATIFCGGPVWSLAWAPTPVDLEVDQILAVSIHKNPDKTYKMSQTYSGAETIQFWNFGALKNTIQLTTLPSLEFCLLHDHGMIWHMEWCPSGCYDEEDSKGLRRMGLLAAACSDGNIVIYSVHFPNKLKECNGPKMIKPKEMFKLIVQKPPEQKLGLWDFQATKLSWTKAAGHNIIAGGYSNGMVCLFNLQTDSPICKSEEDGVTILTPYLTFHPHCAVITALCLYPLDGGARWLVSGSWDRSCKYWDLKDISGPITAYLKRGLITDGVWMTHWLCSFLTYDDVFNLSHTVTTIQNVRDYSYKQTSALATNSMITSISANDWSNAIAQGSLAGELTGSFPRQLLVSFDVDKGLKCKRVIFGYSELVEKNLSSAERLKKIRIKGNNKKDVDFSDKDDRYIFKYFMNKDKEEFDEEPETYHEAQKKYGLVFCDFKLDTYSQIPSDAMSWVRQSNRMHEAPLELYPLMAINRVQWNPNKQAYLYLATGHQTGFVRLKCVRFMNTKF
ncbi:uncharacterized protein CBL_03240 [Carabus blaptoides fortunei]